MSNARPPQAFADTITVQCPACKGTGKVTMRIQYTDRRRLCAEALRTCPVCNGFEIVSAAEDAAFAQKHHPTPAPTGCPYAEDGSYCGHEGPGPCPCRQPTPAGQKP